MLTLRVIRPVTCRPLTLNILRPPVTDHSCYILRSLVSNRIYVGYTLDFSHRLRQHNGEIVGGAKKTKKCRPWTPVCIIRGFYEASSALRFEYRLQHPGRRKRKGENAVSFILEALLRLINSGDGSIEKRNKMPWPCLTITWYSQQYRIDHAQVINSYVV
jgi:structure-specific endonuclease subunit SLX1